MSRTLRFDGRQTMKNATYEVFRYKDDYPKEVALHHHDFYEVYFFLSGNVQYNVESRSYLMTPGDVLLISPMELHQPMFGETHGPYERIVLWMDKTFLENLCLPGEDLARCFDTTAPGHTNLLRPDGVVRQLFQFQLEQLMAEMETGEPYRRTYALTYLVQVLIGLNRLARKSSRVEDVKTRDLAVYNVLSYINDHYNEDLRLDELANRFFISKYHLSREFQRLVGTSVHRYIVQKRLVMAKQMLSTGMPSSEVYQHCGFGDYSNFYRAFKQEYQISPKDFVQRLKQNAYREDALPGAIRSSMKEYPSLPRHRLSRRSVMGMEEKLPHKLQLTERNKLTMTGVTEVASFEENSVVLHTSLGRLLVQGRDLKLKTLSLEGGQVAVDGEISALIYEEPRLNGWRRLLG